MNLRVPLASLAVVLWGSACNCGRPANENDGGLPDAHVDGNNSMDAGNSDGAVDASIDAGPPDAGRTDSGTTDAGPLDASVDAGPRLPDCVSTDGGLVVGIAGFQVTTIALGSPLDDALGITFGRDGRMYVVNSHSWTNASAVRGEILRFENDGGFTAYLDDARVLGPAWVAFGPGGSDGGPGIAYLGTEDSDEALARATDQLLTFDGTTVSDGPNASEVGRVAFGPGGAFGTDLYFAARADPNPLLVPNPGRLMKWAPGGADPTVVPILEGNTLVGLVSGFDFAHGGSLGSDLFVSTYLDSTYTPDSGVALFRVNSNLAATRISSDVLIADLAASPSATGAWGDFLYGAVDSTPASLKRISASGQMTDLIVSYGRAGSVTFGPDGALYFTDLARHSIHKVSACRVP